MSAFVEVDHIDRIFTLSNGEEYIALKNIQLKMNKGEFVTLLGHSGCGKSTLLNIMAGLDRPNKGGIILEGREVTEPGPDRMVVFQNYSLLPWLTVRENVALAVDEVYKKASPTEKKAIVQYHIKLVNLGHAADKLPGALSGGMKQRVAIARALAIRPKLLLLDEPFGALDALTRGGLQEQLMQICQDNQVTAVMVTHDVDEALLLSDRIVMLTNGPSAQIGQILDVNIPRPRERMEVVNHPSYYALRNEIVYFLDQQKRRKQVQQLVNIPTVNVAETGLEKSVIDIGFIPLTDCAPLIIAKEKGFFQEQGFAEVNLSREPSWKAIAQGITNERLDAAQMVAGMPLALSFGLGKDPAMSVVTALVLSRNGDAITFSKKLYEQGIHSLTDFKRLIDQTEDKIRTLGMVHPASMQNLMLRHWLASGGIDPDQDVTLTVIPPPQMFANLKAGNIDGYCVGEPWNSRAVHEDIGVVMATSLDLFAGHVEKVLGVTEAWAEKYPRTHKALVKALLKACEYCDDWRNRQEVLQLLCQDQYLGSDPTYTAAGFLEAFDRGDHTVPEMLRNFNQFFVNQSNCLDSVEYTWMMTQMARWGMIPFPKNWLEVNQRVLRLDVFNEACQELGLVDQSRDRRILKLLGTDSFNPDTPLEYLENLTIKRQLQIKEFPSFSKV